MWVSMIDESPCIDNHGLRYNYLLYLKPWMLLLKLRYYLYVVFVVMMDVSRTNTINSHNEMYNYQNKMSRNLEKHKYNNL